MKTPDCIMSEVRAIEYAEQSTGVTWLAFEHKHSGQPKIRSKHYRSFFGNFILIEN